MTLRVLAVPGSLRMASYNKSLLLAAEDLAPPGMEIAVYQELDAVPLFNEDVANGPTDPPGVVALRNAVRLADGLLIATPEYNQAVPGVLKNAVDWLSMGESHEGLENLPVAVTGVTSGPWGTRLAQTMLRQMLVSTQAIVLPQPALYLRDGASLFDGDGRLVDPKTRARLAELLAAFDRWLHIFTAGGGERRRSLADNTDRTLQCSST